METAVAETRVGKPIGPIVDLAKEVWSADLGREIRIKPEFLGAGQWKSIVDETQEDGQERGFVVSWDGKKILRSDIIKGKKGHVYLPILPHRIRSFMPNFTELTQVHSHYMPEEQSHLRVSPPSQKDIQNFFDSQAKVLAVVDRGGAHVLIKEYHPHLVQPKPAPKPDLIAKAFEKAKQSGGELEEFIKSIAEETQKSGIHYYFAPHHPNGGISSDESVFRNVLAYDNFLKP